METITVLGQLSIVAFCGGMLLFVSGIMVAVLKAASYADDAREREGQGDQQ